MKVTGLLITTIIAAVASAAPQQASTSVTSAPSTTVSLTPVQTCLAACTPGDVMCQAACVGVAHPNASQVDLTTQCAMKCDQGDGSPAATKKYAECQQACIASYFPTSQTVAAGPAGTATGAAASNSASATGSGATASRTGTATGSAASTSSTGAAANNVPVGASAAGLVGIFMAIFAL